MFVSVQKLGVVGDTKLRTLQLKVQKYCRGNVYRDLSSMMLVLSSIQSGTYAHPFVFIHLLEIQENNATK